MPKRQTDEIYLRFIRRQPCCVCGDDVSVEAHHPRVGIINGPDSPGGAQKAADKWAVPLCGRHHRELHTMNEWEFWLSRGLNPFSLAMNYHANPDDDPVIKAMKDRGQL